MNQADRDAAFDRFAARRTGRFAMIARCSQGEQEPADVRSEAWLMARELAMPDGSPIDLDLPACEDFLLARLFQHLVRYTELTVRHAVRLDHAAAGRDPDDVHPLKHRLVSDDGRGPLDTLERQEAAIDEEGVLAASGSLAVAWVRLLRRYDNGMRAVAGHLLISTSWAYRRCARARLLAVCQQPVATPMMTDDFMPGPWRPYPAVRRAPSRQLEFDFDDELAFQS